MTPISTDTINNKQVTIKATLISGEKSTLDTKSIVFELDNNDITSEISINKISTQEVTVIYQPTTDLATGIHKVDVFVKDSNNKSVTKSWTFTIASDDTVQTGYINIFGLQISQRTLIIIGVGILVVIIAIVAPIIIFSVWKEEQKKNEAEEEEGNIIHSIEPTTPIPPAPTTTNIVEDTMPKVEEKEEVIEDAWDNYSAPIPQDEEVKEPVKPVMVETPVVEPSIPEEPVTVETVPEPVITPTTVEAPTPVEPIAVPTETKTTAEVVPPVEDMLPPEPDLTADIPVDDDLSAILDQIQQTQKNDTESSEE